MGNTITELLTGKTPAERAIIKAEQLVARIGSHLPHDYSLNGLDISVLTVAVERGCFALTLTAHDGTAYLPVPDYAAGERFLFMNPPIRKWTRAPGTNGEDDIGAADESPIEVAQGFVYDAVVAYARNHGWEG